ncbi:farnesyl diphosphate synthase [Brevibacillus choshinensis]|uniref:polyprenyl synthetase family protein n=1 Tax=Brevibacillus choshinensis TaxID=54911 RepID=UPI002E2118D2|nr:farnesyl diphosphate synthase [Brevibacillus choshinensis]MED4581537.1 polyprenyl synthetase family protein [Brevibacillus choshinensis]MED4751193.1 polyprenyl synthetase family protein [Brevibacillus choshinensis]
MAVDTFDTYLAEKTAYIEDKLTPGLEQVGVPTALYESMNYSLMAGGKRLRPMLVLAVLEALDKPIERGVPFAVALEMIHTYSLIHDDLPAMDDDDLRRGKPTNHKVYGEATAILAGDALLTRAFSLIAESYRERTDVSALTTVNLIAELGKRAGATGMVGGQMADIEGESKRLELNELEFIHEHKTGDLLIAALRGGGYLAEASEKQMEKLTRYGYCIGLAFQIQDDILNVEGDAVELGKAVGSDAERQKATYPSLLGLEESKVRVAALIASAKAALAEAGLEHSALMPLADYVSNRKK